MRRREFLSVLGGAAAWPLAAGAQQRPAKVALIGFLGLGRASAWTDQLESLRAGLRDLGYVEGKKFHHRIPVGRWGRPATPIGGTTGSHEC
jgi:putative tryptophan/tyrosine transport system substrate-binding protein